MFVLSNPGAPPPHGGLNSQASCQTAARRARLRSERQDCSVKLHCPKTSALDAQSGGVRLHRFLRGINFMLRSIRFVHGPISDITLRLRAFRAARFCAPVEFFTLDFRWAALHIKTA